MAAKENKNIRFLDQRWTVAVCDLDVALARLNDMATGATDFPSVLQGDLLPIVTRLRHLRRRLLLQQASAPRVSPGLLIDKWVPPPTTPKMLVFAVGSENLAMDEGWLKTLVKESGVAYSTVYDWWRSFSKETGYQGKPHAADQSTRRDFIAWLGQTDA
jgi:hypothetical protein